MVDNARKSTLLPIVEDHVEEGSTVSTDEYRAYKALRQMGYDHGSVVHSMEQWVDGIHYTNPAQMLPELISSFSQQADQ